MFSAHHKFNVVPLLYLYELVFNMLTHRRHGQRAKNRFLHSEFNIIQFPYSHNWTCHFTNTCPKSKFQKWICSNYFTILSIICLNMFIITYLKMRAKIINKINGIEFKILYIINLTTCSCPILSHTLVKCCFCTPGLQPCAILNGWSESFSDMEFKNTDWRGEQLMKLLMQLY